MPSILAILGLNAGPFKAAMNDAKSYATGFGHHLKSSLGGLVSVGALEETVRRTIEWGDHIYDTAVRLGMSTDAVQQWDFALKASGSSIEDAIPFFERLAVARDKALRGKASEEQIQAFKTLGITMDDLAKKRDMGSIIAAKVEAGIDQDSLTAALKALGGRSAGAMIPVFKSGLGELLGEAPVVDEKTIVELQDASDRMKEVFAQIRAGIAPVITWIMNVATGAFHGLSMAINGVVGAFGEMFRQSAAVISDPLKFIKDYKKNNKMPDGFGFGEVLKAGKEQALEYGRSVVEAEKKHKEAIEREKRIVRGPRDGGDDDFGAGGKKKADHILKLKDELAKKQQKNDLESLGREGQMLELGRRRAAIVATMTNPRQTEEGKLNAALDIEDIDEQLRKLRVVGGVERVKDPKHQAADLNSLQKIGGMFVSSPLEMTQLEVSKSMAHDIREIKEHFKGHKTGWHGTKH